MRFVLGVDAGASKTAALVADDRGLVLGWGQAGPGNHQLAGLEAATDEIRRSCEEALARAKVSRPVDLGFFGLAGADLPIDYAFLTPAVEGLGYARQVRVKNDTMVALRSGLTRSWGVVIICGTGFNAGGIAPGGQEFQLLGLGSLSGDWGGGSDIASEALRLVSRAWDGRGQPTLLTELILSELGFQTVEEMISKIYEGQSDCYPGDFDQRRLLSLVPLVFEAAERGDRVARDLLVRVGTEVGTTANAVIKRLGLETTDVEVVLGGGVFRGPGSLLLDTVTESIHQVAPRATIVLPQFEPVVGAVLLALEALGIEIDEAVYANLRSSLASVPAPARGPQTTGPG